MLYIVICTVFWRYMERTRKRELFGLEFQPDLCVERVDLWVLFMDLSMCSKNKANPCPEDGPEVLPTP